MAVVPPEQARLLSVVRALYCPHWVHMTQGDGHFFFPLDSLSPQLPLGWKAAQVSQQGMAPKGSFALFIHLAINI